MPRPSTIKRLPPEVRERIGALLEQGRTLDEIVAALDALDVDVSRSALHRYKQQLDKVGERIRRSRAMAEALAQRYGAEPESKVARVNIGFLHAAITDVISSAESEDGGVSLDPRAAMELAKALDHLGKAARNDVEMTVRIREEATKEATSKAAATVSDVGRAAGVPGDVIDQMMQAVLGGAV